MSLASTETAPIPLVDLQAQYQSIKGEIDRAIASVIADGAFIQGPHARRFEESFADTIGTRYCIGCGNGTDALEIALGALGIRAGDEVIVPANTWISTAEAVTTVGAQVVFADIDPDSHTLSLPDVERRLTGRTRAIIPVHLYGQAADMSGIRALADTHGLKIIEDCAQAHLAKFRGQTVGTFGEISTFSFYPGKNLGAYGDAGAICTNSEELAQFCRRIQNHGRDGKFDHLLEGRNSRLDGIQAAILSAKLPHLADWTYARRAHAARLIELLAGSELILPKTRDDTEHVFHLFVVRTPYRDQLRKHLMEQGIHTGIHYPRALPFLKAYARFGHRAEDFPVAHRLMDEILSLPMYPELSLSQLDRIASTTLDILRRVKK